MIGRLTGKVVTPESDGSVVIDVGGVGYELVVPLGTIGRAAADGAGHVTLWVHTHVREDVIALFGFADEQERAAFRSLLGVSNVGPKIAVAVLGALPVDELSRAIARRDLGAITAVSGVGKKLGERLILELRDKLPASPPATVGVPSAAHRAARPAQDEDERLRGTLTGLGFKPSEAERAAASVGDRDGQATFEEKLREALALLAK